MTRNIPFALFLPERPHFCEDNSTVTCGSNSVVAKQIPMATGKPWPPAPPVAHVNPVCQPGLEGCLQLYR